MISVTALNSYIYCKRKLFLERILGFIEPPKEATVKGQIRHQVYDRINKIEKEIVKNITKPDFEEIFGIYRRECASILRDTLIKNEEKLRKFNLGVEEAFAEFLPLVLEESRIRAENVFNFVQKYDLSGEELWLRLTPKIKSEIKISSERLNLIGVVDRLEVYDDKLILLELKTGSVPKEGVWPGHRVQLAAYNLLLEDNFNTKVEAFVHYLDAQEKRKVVLNPFLKAEIIQLTNNVEDLLRQKEPPDFTANENKCNVCGLKATCFNEKLINKRLKEVFTAQ